VQLVDQWRAIERDLPAGWDEVRLTLSTELPGDLERATQVLGSMGAGRLGHDLALRVRRAGTPSPEAARRLFGILDEQRVWCTLAVAEARDEPAAETAEAAATLDEAGPLAAQWQRVLGELPDDWGSLLCELQLDSTDLLPRVALLCAPLNPRRVAGRRAFSFRVARRAGYGAAVGITGRCLQRCDEEALPGRVAVTGLFPLTDNVATQGPVFVVGGRPL
jgi:hypothetical protein